MLHCPVSDAYTGLFSAQIGLVINQKNFVIVLINVIISIYRYIYYGLVHYF